MNFKDEFIKLLKLESKSASYYILSTSITGIGSFIIVPLFWHKLTPSDFGIVAIIEILSSFLGVFYCLALDQSITRFFYEWKLEERPTRVGNLWIVGWLSSIILQVIFLLIFNFISQYLFPDVKYFPFIFFGIIISGLTSFRLIPFTTLRILNQPRQYTFYEIITFFTNMASLVLFILVLDKKLMGYFYGSMLGGSINFLIFLSIMLKVSKPTINFKQLREAFSFSLPFIPSNFISNVSMITDRFILQQFADLHVLGIYSIGLKFATIISKLHSALKLSFIPFLHKIVIERGCTGQKIVSEMIGVYVAPLFLLGVAICLFADDFIRFYGNKPYFEVINYIPPLVIIMIITSLYIYYSPGIYLSKKTKYLIIPTLSQLVILISSSILLIPKFKILGIIGSRFIGTTIFLSVAIYLSCRLYKWKNNYLSLLFLTFSIVAVIFLDEFITFSNAYLSLSKSVFLFGLYVLANYAFFIRTINNYKLVENI